MDLFGLPEQITQREPGLIGRIPHLLLGNRERQYPTSTFSFFFLFRTSAPFFKAVFFDYFELKHSGNTFTDVPRGLSSERF